MGFCPRCRHPISDTATTGVSSIYQSNNMLLCEPCFLDEETQIDDAGTNHLPETLKQYENNIRLGPIR